jgi:hypothetical protein
MRRLGRVSAVGLVVALAGCAGIEPWQPPGEGDGCRNQVTSFTSAGDPFLPARPVWQRPNLAGAVQPTLASTLDAENAEIEALQIAFDSLLYCRWIEARTVRADIAARRVTADAGRARMAALKARVARDLARAQEVLAAMERRAAARDAELEAAAPGSRAATERARAERGRIQRVVAAATVTLRLRPESGAPEVGRVGAGDAVTLRPAGNGFALVEGAGTTRGYAPLGAFQAAERAPAAVAASGGDVRRLVATNIARRDNFAESIALATEAAATGFEVAG